jgi:hypothetical protein
MGDGKRVDKGERMANPEKGEVGLIEHVLAFLYRVTLSPNQLIAEIIKRRYIRKHPHIQFDSTGLEKNSRPEVRRLSD